MIIIGTLLIVVGLGLGLLGFMADSMSDAPGKTSGVAPWCIGFLVFGVIAIVMGVNGVHLP